MAYSFIDGLEKSSNKKMYQEYEVKMGIDRAKAFIPLNKTSIFEEQMHKTRPTKRSEIRSIIEELGGILE